MKGINSKAKLEELQELRGRHAKYHDPKDGDKVGTIHDAIDQDGKTKGLWLVFVYSDPASGDTRKELLTPSKFKHMELLK